MKRRKSKTLLVKLPKLQKLRKPPLQKKMRTKFQSCQRSLSLATSRSWTPEGKNSRLITQLFQLPKLLSLLAKFGKLWAKTKRSLILRLSKKMLPDTKENCKTSTQKAFSSTRMVKTAKISSKKKRRRKLLNLVSSQRDLYLPTCSTTKSWWLPWELKTQKLKWPKFPSRLVSNGVSSRKTRRPNGSNLLSKIKLDKKRSSTNSRPKATSSTLMAWNQPTWSRRNSSTLKERWCPREQLMLIRSTWKITKRRLSKRTSALTKKPSRSVTKSGKSWVKSKRPSTSTSMTKM